MTEPKFAFSFGFGKAEAEAEGGATMTEILGGKGARLAGMSEAGLNVPPGITFSTELCGRYKSAPKGTLKKVLFAAKARIAEIQLAEGGKKRLYSVRSGARVSMPGMMDTILNVGMEKEDLPYWKKTLGERAALDCYRRLIQMLGTTAYNVDSHLFEAALEIAKTAVDAHDDSEIPAAKLEWLIEKYEAIFETAVGKKFPDTTGEQLSNSVVAVWNSWNSDRAKAYRKDHAIPNEWGTAVTVQAMVFGNLNDQSGSGVLFTRCPTTGEKKVVGEFLVNAQGEEVVAGTRTPMNLDKMFGLWPAVQHELMGVVLKLEKTYRDMQDVEFTVENGKLFILQSRNGKRESLAKFRIAHDMVGEDLITKTEAVARVTHADYLITKQSKISSSFDQVPMAKGLAACSGVITGKPVTSLQGVLENPHNAIFVAVETSPDDYEAMSKSKAVLTLKGGLTSHAAVVCRAMNKPCVSGAGGLTMEEIQKQDVLSIDGGTGRIWFCEVPVEQPVSDKTVLDVISWAYETTGTVPISDKLEFSNQILVLAGKTKEELEAVCKQLSESPAAQKISLEAMPSSSYGLAEDAEMWDLDGGLSDRNCLEVGAILEVLCAKLLSMGDLAIFTLPEFVVKMEAAGFKVSRDAKTVADLMSGAPVQISSKFIKEVLGGDKILQELTDKFGPFNSPAIGKKLADVLGSKS